METHAISVAVGLLTSLLGWAGLQLAPIILDFFRKETRVNGEWKWFDSTNQKSVGTVSIKQSGNRVRGSFKRTQSSSGTTTDRTFRLTGNVYGHTLHLQYHEPDDPQNIRGSVILRIVPGRKCLYGRSMYFNSFLNKIETPRFVLSLDDKLEPEETKYLLPDGQTFPHLTDQSIATHSLQN